MGFTLGGLDELADDQVLCLIAIDDYRTVQAITSWPPVYRDGQTVAWTLDFMQRRPGGADRCCQSGQRRVGGVADQRTRAGCHR